MAGFAEGRVLLEVKMAGGFGYQTGFRSISPKEFCELSQEVIRFKFFVEKIVHQGVFHFP